MRNKVRSNSGAIRISCDRKEFAINTSLMQSVCVFLCVVVLDAVEKWRTERESRLSGEKQQEEEEEQSIYSTFTEEVNCPFTGSTHCFVSSWLT